MSVRTQFQVNLEESVKYFTGHERKINASAGTWLDIAEALESYQVLPQEFCYWIVLDYGDDPGPVKFKMPSLLLTIIESGDFNHFAKTREASYNDLFDRDLKRVAKQYRADVNIFTVLNRDSEDYLPLLRVEAALDQHSLDDAMIPFQKEVVNYWADIAHRDLIGHPYMTSRVPKFTQLVQSKNKKIIL